MDCLPPAPPAGTYGRIAPRSGLAWKNSIDVGAGVIDEDYRGNVGVILFNHGDKDFDIKAGDRVAQVRLRTRTPACTHLQKRERGGGRR
jgi:dUTP pyrophosphatase